MQFGGIQTVILREYKKVMSLANTIIYFGVGCKEAKSELLWTFLHYKKEAKWTVALNQPLHLINGKVSKEKQWISANCDLLIYKLLFIKIGYVLSCQMHHELINLKYDLCLQEILFQKFLQILIVDMLTKKGKIMIEKFLFYNLLFTSDSSSITC